MSSLGRPQARSSCLLHLLSHSRWYRQTSSGLIRLTVKAWAASSQRARGVCAWQVTSCSSGSITACQCDCAGQVKSALERRAKGSRDKHHWVSLTDLWAAFQLPAACRALDPNTQADIDRSRLNNVYPDLDNTSATKQFLLKCAYGSPLIDIALCSLLQSFTLTSPYGPERDNQTGTLRRMAMGYRRRMVRVAEDRHAGNG